eukprot:TRINITY_DN84685_c0_g1_i1.p1 TRINITY_DN84685_c0_g1~~TRINITY_DN84685_c0_g1_i1.p1  ORF type:complete len:427 (+),score=55.41 TRINITY_DN84685_c0_g1_i1:99-1379(+)
MMEAEDGCRQAPMQPRAKTHLGHTAVYFDEPDAISEDEALGVGKRGRMTSAPAKLYTRQDFLVRRLDAVDSGLPCEPAQGKNPAEEAGIPPLPPLANCLLCLVSLISGCLIPALVDLSRTATLESPDGVTERRFPYTPHSIIRSEASFNMVLGLVMIGSRAPERSFSKTFSTLWSKDLHLSMLPLTLVYFVGDFAALCAIGSAGGPLLIAVSNTRLIFSAVASRIFLRRGQTTRQWFSLVAITAATMVYTVLSTSYDGSQSNSIASSAYAGIGWAVLKACCSSIAAVLTEKRYEKLDLWRANTLLKMQTLLVSCLFSVLLAGNVQQKSVWDCWTWAVLAGEVGSGWLNIAILTRMSAVVKFVCKAGTSPCLYLLYCVTGFGGLQFQLPTFAAAMSIAVGILMYSDWSPWLRMINPRWVDNYSQVRT